MLEAIKRENLTGPDGKIDIYNFMRSAEIREYMRANKTFCLSDKIYIILRSMNPLTIKLEALKLLSEDPDLTEDERIHALKVLEYTQKISDEINNPGAPAFFAMTECYSREYETLNSYEASKVEQNRTGYYMSYQEIVDGCKKYPPEEREELPRYEICLVYMGKKCDENNPIYFSATWFDGNIEIYAITVVPEWGEGLGYDDSVIEYFYIGETDRYSLPFPNLSMVQIKTPFMTEALRGVLDSSIDGLGCWYHFFYPIDSDGEVGNCMDFSYQMLNISDDFTVFDWVSSAEGEITPEQFREVCFLNFGYTSIADIKADTNISLIARVDKVVDIEEFDDWENARIVKLQLSDDTGKLVVPVIAKKDDLGWFENVARRHLYIRMNVDIKADDKGELYAEQTMDISTVDEKQVKLFKKS